MTVKGITWMKGACIKSTVKGVSLWPGAWSIIENKVEY